VASSTADAPTAWPAVRRGAASPVVTLRQNLEHSLPFLAAGVLMVGVGVWFGFSHLHPAGSRGAFWLLVVGLGATLVGGGLALTISEPPDDVRGPTAYGDYVLVPRSDWVRWQEEGYPPFGQAGPGAPEPLPEPPIWQETEPEGAGPGTTAPMSVAPVSSPALSDTASVPTPPPSVAPAAAAPPPSANDSDLIAQVSEELLRAPRHPWIEASVPPPPSPPSGVPAWREDAIQRLEAELAAIEPETQPPATHAPTPVPPGNMERCISCGGETTSYSEQVCVMCDRPLCDACLERSVAEGRPSVCPYCKLPDRP
jgi:hypothetical protein